MRAVIVSHGEVNDYEYIGNIMRDSDMVVCADGGAEYPLKCGIIPHAVIGDLDSINQDVLKSLNDKGCIIIKHPREKDYTDTQLAIDYAIENGAREIIMVASIGDRLDHTLANIFLLVKLAKKNIYAHLINEKNTIYIVSNSISLKGNLGDLISLIPLGGNVKGIYTEGLKYKLDDATMEIGDPLGISNVFINEDINIKIESGYLLVIKSRD